MARRPYLYFLRWTRDIHHLWDLEICSWFALQDHFEPGVLPRNSGCMSMLSLVQCVATVGCQRSVYTRPFVIIGIITVQRLEMWQQTEGLRKCRQGHLEYASLVLLNTGRFCSVHTT